VTIRGLARHPSPFLRVYRCGIADIIARVRLRSATTLAWRLALGLPAATPPE
jgi:hypothetical protein